MIWSFRGKSPFRRRRYPLPSGCTRTIVELSSLSFPPLRPSFAYTPIDAVKRNNLLQSSRAIALSKNINDNNTNENKHTPHQRFLFTRTSAWHQYTGITNDSIKTAPTYTHYSQCPPLRHWFGSSTRGTCSLCPRALFPRQALMYQPSSLMMRWAPYPASSSSSSSTDHNSFAANHRSLEGRNVHQVAPCLCFKQAPTSTPHPLLLGVTRDHLIGCTVYCFIFNSDLSPTLNSLNSVHLSLSFPWTCTSTCPTTVNSLQRAISSVLSCRIPTNDTGITKSKTHSNSNDNGNHCPSLIHTAV